MIHKHTCMLWFIALLIGYSGFLSLFEALPEVCANDMAYVGSESCQECHEEQYESYTEYSKKADSYKSVKVMRKGITDEEYRACLQCHATGFGKPGGFVSVEKTPHLQNLGCESCHGPGSAHVDSGDPEDINGELTASDCERCHNSDRVENFNFKPLLFGGAH